MSDEPYGDVYEHLVKASELATESEKLLRSVTLSSTSYAHQMAAAANLAALAQAHAMIANTLVMST